MVYYYYYYLIIAHIEKRIEIQFVKTLLSIETQLNEFVFQYNRPRPNLTNIRRATGMCIVQFIHSPIRCLRTNLRIVRASVTVLLESVVSAFTGFVGTCVREGLPCLLLQESERRALVAGEG